MPHYEICFAMWSFLYFEMQYSPPVVVGRPPVFRAPANGMATRADWRPTAGDFGSQLTDS